MDSFDNYVSNSQDLNFLDTHIDNELIWGDTQGSQFEGKIFTLPSISQTEPEPEKETDKLEDEIQKLSIKEEDEEEVKQEKIKDEEKEDEFSCAYCGINDPATIVKCNLTNKWFCNGRGTTSGSHIVNHLVRARAKEITLHPEGPLKDSTLECYICGSKNVFLLGFVPAKSESVVALLCRHPCAYQNRDMNWNPTEWQPLIQERQFLPWLVKVPTDAQQLEAKQITATEMHTLEDTWRDSMNSKNKETLETANLDIKPITLEYESMQDYRDTFISVIKIESQYDKFIKESICLENVTVRWEVGLHKKKKAYFCIPPTNVGQELKFTIDDEIILKIPWNDNYYTGRIIKVADVYSDEIGVEVDAAASEETIFDIKFKWKSISFDRMITALLNFGKSNLPTHICQRLIHSGFDDIVLKCDLPKKYSAPGLPELNHSQVFAVKTVLQRPLSLIQGPPGTGKTVTSATIVYHLHKINKKKVLVVAPSNTAVDQLCEKIDRTGLKVVRVCSKTRETMESKIERLMLHVQALHLPGFEDFKKLHQLKEEIGELDAKDLAIYDRLRNRAFTKVLENADVVCCTCVCSGTFLLKRIKFSAVLVDESTQATEPEILIPLVDCMKQVILVGDHCQLGPVILCKNAVRAGLKQSLFERLVLMGIRPIRLQVQYRMHPCLSSFPSNVFYEGSLQNGVTAEDRTKIIDFPWPNPNKPMFFYCINGKEEISGNGISYLNRAEAVAVEKVVSKLIQAGVSSSNIGVVTPYEGQRLFLIHHFHSFGSMNMKLYQDIEVASVDAFQGREKDYIILSCVRANENQGIGFLNDPRRLNVAITRAKYGLIIVGYPRVLAKNPLWNELIHYFQEKHLMFEGPINNLTEYMEKFSPNKAPYTYKPGLNLPTQANANDRMERGFITNNMMINTTMPPPTYGMRNNGFDQRGPMRNAGPNGAMNMPANSALSACTALYFNQPSYPVMNAKGPGRMYDSLDQMSRQVPSTRLHNPMEHVMMSNPLQQPGPTNQPVNPFFDVMSSINAGGNASNNKMIGRIPIPFMNPSMGPNSAASGSSYKAQFQNYLSQSSQVSNYNDFSGNPASSSRKDDKSRTSKNRTSKTDYNSSQLYSQQTPSNFPGSQSSQNFNSQNILSQDSLGMDFFAKSNSQINGNGGLSGLPENFGISQVDNPLLSQDMFDCGMDLLSQKEESQVNNAQV